MRCLLVLASHSEPGGRNRDAHYRNGGQNTTSDPDHRWRQEPVDAHRVRHEAVDPPCSISIVERHQQSGGPKDQIPTKPCPPAHQSPRDIRCPVWIAALDQTHRGPVEDRWEVREGGLMRLWERVEDVLFAYDEAGRPGS